MATDLRERLEQYFTQYGDALASFDAERSANMWGMPGTIVSDDFVGTLATREEMTAGLRQSYPLYQQLGLGGVRFEILDVAELTQRITRVKVRWLFDSADGELLTDSSYEYLLRADEDGLHAYVSVGLDDATKLRELAERKGVPLPARPNA